MLRVGVMLGSSSHRLLFLFIFLELAIFMASPVTEKEVLLQFKGNVSSDPFRSLKSWDPSKSPCIDYSGVFCDSNGNVVKLLLWNTSLAGVLSGALSELKSLRIITLYGNQFTGNIPPEYGSIDTLWKINFSSNALSGPIPEFLGDLTNLRFLDLSRNGFSGEIPRALFASCYRNRFISLAHNNLSGEIPISIANCSNLEGLDLSFNDLIGPLPAEICILPKIAHLSVKNNMLSGIIGDHISGCRSLELLDLASNMFAGPGPFEALRSANLVHFNISSNRFEGEIPEIRTCPEKFEYLDASVNGFYGEIPHSITRCSGLKYLDLGFNRLGGNIPVGLSSLKSLSVVRLANNSIGGAFPVELGRIALLQVLDLHNMRLHGEIPADITRCRFLLELDVSGNFLEGEIPENLDNMTYLVILDVHGNRLHGGIPPPIGNLSHLRSLDFSENSLSGPIPTTLANLHNLAYFNVSYNNLSGPIPTFPTIQGFGFRAFFHNPGLCGAPLDNPCPVRASSISAARKPNLSPSVIAAAVVAALIAAGVCIITVVNLRARARARAPPPPSAATESNVVIGKLVLFGKNLPSRYEDWEAGTKALLDKECRIGGGSIGAVYRTTFDGGASIAVKTLDTLGRIRNQDEFEEEIGRLGSLCHPNLVPMQGYYWSPTMRLILSEFVPNGNLYENLHGLGLSELNWPRRFRIALGTARALAYLHHDCNPPVLHLAVKSANILLDEDYAAKVSDYGMVKLLPMLDADGSTKTHSSVGYVAPELARSSGVGDKCDVYGFGVILMELVTGRKPVERGGGGGREVVVLGEVVRGLIERGAASECFDRRLRGFSENEMVQVMKLGLVCTSEVAARRPSMSEAVQVLESIRNGSEL